MNVNQIIIDVMVLFMALGAFDKITQKKFKRIGLADSFDEGISAMGPLAVTAIGMLVLAPALSGMITKVIGPVYHLMGADPAMFAGTLISSDLGAYPLAASLTEDHDIVCFSGLILGGVFGVVISFTIPIALGILREEDRQYFARGMLYGVLPTPIGALAGGIAAGYSMRMMLINLVPVLVLVILLAIGIKLAPEAMVRGFSAFGRIITAVITLGLAASIVTELTGIVIIPGMASVKEGFLLVGSLAIVLAGAYPLLEVVMRVFRSQLQRAGRLVRINEYAVTGMIACLANAIPMFNLMKNMDERGKIVNSAFAVSGAYALGDHLAYTASVEKALILPVILAKLASGVLAVVLALLMTKHLRGPEQEQDISEQ